MRLRLFFFIIGLSGSIFSFTGCQSQPDYPPHFTRIYLEESSRMPTQQTFDLTLPLSETRVVVRAKPSFFEWDVMYASQFETDLGPAVVFLFNPEAARDLYRLTLGNQGKRLLVTINGVPLGARYIDRPIEDGRLPVYLEVADEDLPEMVRNIQLTSQDLQQRTQRR